VASTSTGPRRPGRGLSWPGRPRRRGHDSPRPVRSSGSPSIRPARAAPSARTGPISCAAKTPSILIVTKNAAKLARMPKTSTPVIRSPGGRATSEPARAAAVSADAPGNAAVAKRGRISRHAPATRPVATMATPARWANAKATFTPPVTPA
jgi:hypothetical protein